MNVEDFINPELYDFCVLLTENGYNVRIPKKPYGHKITYVYIEKDDKLCSCQFSHFVGLTLYTSHIANKECGTGFEMKDTLLTISGVDKVINCYTPYWARSYKPKKYRDWKHYLEFNYYNDTDFTLFEVNNEQPTN